MSYADIVKVNATTGRIEFPVGGIGEAQIINGHLVTSDGTNHVFGIGKLKDFETWCAHILNAPPWMPTPRKP